MTRKLYKMKYMPNWQRNKVLAEKQNICELGISPNERYFICAAQAWSCKHSSNRETLHLRQYRGRPEDGKRCINYVKGECLVDEKEIFEICNQVDSYIAAELTESIVSGTSYDLLEAHHGILPISRNCFYRKRRIVRKIMEKRMGRIVEEKNGQLRMVWLKHFDCAFFYKICVQ